jgi:aspartate aminotransferase
MRFSKLAQGIQTSPIITLAAEINEKIQRGEKFYNLTIGDFDPQIFPIPEALREEINAAYLARQTNYPGALGALNLREAVSQLLLRYSNVHYHPNDILIAGGGRPLIHCLYQTVVDPGDTVIFPAPSWNNDYYAYLAGGRPVILETTPENNFMPTAEEIEPYIKEATLLALCSPQNPSGTVISKSALEEICDLVLQENHRRRPGKKPLYIMFDQIYWLITFGNFQHYNAVNLRPEIRDYAVFIDGISKAFCGTGVRVGWAFGPPDVIKKMRSFVAHIGAWAPKPEQAATGKFLMNIAAVESHLNCYRREVEQRLEGFYKGFIALKNKGYRVNAIEPQAAIYLTVQLDLRGQKTASGALLKTNHDVHRYILDEAKIGLVPFPYFGASEESSWYRLSVGTCRPEEVEVIMASLENALRKLTN